MLTSYNGKDLTEIVGAVYDCIADAAHWDSALNEIREVCGGFVATLGVIDIDTNARRFSVASGDRNALSLVTSLPASGMPFLAAVPKMELDVPYKMTSIYEVQGPAAREKLLNSRLHQEWVVPNGIDDCVWVPLVKTAGRTGHLVVITHKTRGAVTPADLEMMGQLAPHVRRAVTIGDLFEAERGKGEIFRDVIDALHTPVIIVAADLQILFANLSAEKMLSEKEVICSRSGRLDFSFGHAGNAIGHAVATSRKDEFVLGPAGINVPLLRAQIPAVAHVMPLARRDHPHRVSQHAAAAIFVSTAGNAPVPAMDAIGALFGLTPAEKNIAAQISSGRKTSEIAEMGGTTENTVRTQIRAVLDKTGTHDQRGLNSLIRELTPPLRSG